jgi:hypothetical protein
MVDAEEGLEGGGGGCGNGGSCRVVRVRGDYGDGRADGERGRRDHGAVGAVAPSETASGVLAVDWPGPWLCQCRSSRLRLSSRSR